MANESIYGVFGTALATRRKALGLTQERLASKVKMSRAAIANIEVGRQKILLHHVYTLAEALECRQISDLLPPRAPQKQMSGELKMSRLNEKLSPEAEAQVNELIAHAIGQRRNPRSGS